MKNQHSPLSGIIYDGDKQFNFHLDNYCVTFMSIDYTKEIQLGNPFVFGETYGFKNIAIYKGDAPISICGMKKLNTGAYIIASQNALSTDWSGFDYIEFRGGILNSLFFCNALTSERKDGGVIQISQRNDAQRYEFKMDDSVCEFVIGSTTTESRGLAGVSISNNEVGLLLRFSGSQPLQSAFAYIGKVKEMLSIMAFRKNIDFDEIYLHHNDTAFSKMQVFLKSDVQISTKSIYHNITFPELGDGVSKLASIIFNSKDKQPAYEIGFLPTSDKDVHLMSNDKVRLICSALECELSFVDDLCPNEDEHLQNLIVAVKQYVKKHRAGPNKLSSRTYDLIFSSISTWSMSASDKVCLLFHLHEKEMSIILSKTIRDISIGDDEILKFIKYRNSITHGSYRVMDEEIATIAFVLQGLVYCCLLKRIGVSEDSILSLCQNGKILT